MYERLEAHSEDSEGKKKSFLQLQRWKRTTKQISETSVTRNDPSVSSLRRLPTCVTQMLQKLSKMATFNFSSLFWSTEKLLKEIEAGDYKRGWGVG